MSNAKKTSANLKPVASIKEPAAKRGSTAAAGSRGRTREKIMAAGLSLFAQQGVDATSVTELEEKAGLKPGSGSFYRHFSNKEELFAEVIQAEVSRIKSQSAVLSKTLEGSLGDTRAELRLHVRSMLVGFSLMEDFIRILAQEQARGPELMALLADVLVTEGRATEAERLKEKIDAGEVVAVDPERLSSLILSAVSGFALMRIYAGGDTVAGDDEAFVDTLVSVITREMH